MSHRPGVQVGQPIDKLIEKTLEAKGSELFLKILEIIDKMQQQPSPPPLPPDNPTRDKQHIPPPPEPLDDRVLISDDISGTSGPSQSSYGVRSGSLEMPIDLLQLSTFTNPLKRDIKKSIKNKSKLDINLKEGNKHKGVSGKTEDRRGSSSSKGIVGREKEDDVIKNKSEKIEKKELVKKEIGSDEKNVTSSSTGVDGDDDSNGDNGDGDNGDGDNGDGDNGDNGDGDDGDSGDGDGDSGDGDDGDGDSGDGDDDVLFEEKMEEKEEKESNEEIEPCTLLDTNTPPVCNNNDTCIAQDINDNRSTPSSKHNTSVRRRSARLASIEEDKKEPPPPPTPPAPVVKNSSGGKRSRKRKQSLDIELSDHETKHDSEKEEGRSKRPRISKRSRKRRAVISSDSDGDLNEKERKKGRRTQDVTVVTPPSNSPVSSPVHGSYVVDEEVSKEDMVEEKRDSRKENKRRKM